MRIEGMGAPTDLPRPETHQVRPGDTLDSVARLHGVQPDDLAQANQIPRGGELTPGRELIIPERPRSAPGHEAASLQEEPFAHSQVIDYKPTGVEDLVGADPALPGDIRAAKLAPAVDEHVAPGDIRAAKLSPAFNEDLVAEKLAPGLDEHIVASRQARGPDQNLAAEKLAPSLDEHIVASRQARGPDANLAAEKLAPSLDEHIVASRQARGPDANLAAEKLAPSLDEHIVSDETEG